MAIIDRLEEIDRRAREVAETLSRPETVADSRRFRELAREHARLEQGSRLLAAYRGTTQRLAQAEEMLLSEKDAELVAMAEDEARSARDELAGLEQEIRLFLIPPDSRSGRDIIVELRAGTGGNESALFVADLVRMYTRFAEDAGLKVELLSSHPTELGGYKEFIIAVSGERAWDLFRFESGAHRVQRVPETESGGRTHTSAATVAVMPEAEESEIVIGDKDLRIDVYRSSGPGGQSVNTTDSAVRITHIPTGLIVTCQDEKSQHKNKAKALKVLRARLAERMEAERNSELSAMRRSQIGTGDRSERIRTYNFNENRVTDHRIHETWHKLPEIVAGNLNEVVAALEKDRRETLLAEIARSGEQV